MADFNFKKTGDWDKAKKTLTKLRKDFDKSAKKAVLKEAQFYRAQIVKTFNTSGKHAGVSWPPISDLTRRLKRGKSKPLIDKGDLRNSVTVIERGNGAVFIGVPSKKRRKNGGPLVDIARVHEFGKVIAVPVTRRMMAGFFARLKAAGVQPNGQGTGRMKVGSVMLIDIPKRSFIISTYNKFYGNAGQVRARVKKRIAQELGPEWV